MPQPKPQYRANKKYIKKTLKKVDRKQPVPQTTGFFYYNTQPPKTEEKFSVTTSKLEDTFALYLKSLGIKYERQFKAVETFFLMARKEISSRFAMSLELWGRGAEYLMDPWLSFQGYGALMKFTIKGDS